MDPQVKKNSEKFLLSIQIQQDDIFHCSESVQNKYSDADTLPKEEICVGNTHDLDRLRWKQISNSTWMQPWLASLNLLLV